MEAEELHDADTDGQNLMHQSARQHQSPHWFGKVCREVLEGAKEFNAGRVVPAHIKSWGGASEVAADGYIINS